MKKIVLVATMVMVAVVAHAQARDKAVEEQTIEYATEQLRCEDLAAISVFIPSQLTLVDGQEGFIEISYPVQERQYLNFGIVEGDIGKMLVVGRNGNVKPPKDTILSEDVPVYIKVSASQLRRILNRQDMILRIERNKFAHDLQLCNTLTLGVLSESITAKDRIYIFNNGTMTCQVKHWNTALLDVYNNGYLYVHGTTTAKHVKQTCGSKSISNIDLAVDCQMLSILSRGKGELRYRGKADDVKVSQRGKRCSIYISELNRE